MCPPANPPDRPGQLALDLPHSASSALDDFVRGKANARALDFILAWPRWPHGAALLVGPPGAGKSHLARIWAARSGAHVIHVPAADMSPWLREAPLLAVIEDIDAGDFDETALFHLFNHSHESGGSLLVTACAPASQLSISLPDLASRLRAATLVEIDEPGDALIEAVLVKLFADRQIDVGPEIASFAAARMERSLAAAGDLVARIDRRSLEEGRRVTTRLVARVLGEMANAAERP